MFSQSCPVFAILIATCIQSGLSAGDWLYGATQMEKAAGGVCLFEHPAPHLTPWCKTNVGFINNYHHQHSGFLTNYPNASPELEHDVMTSWMRGQSEGRIQFLFPRYTSCNSFFTNVDQEPNKDYSWLLGDGDDQYPYKAAAHCVLEKMEEIHGQQAVDKLSELWGTSNQPTDKATDEGEAEENTEDVAEESEPEKSKFTIEDVEYGLELAQKAAAGVCWVEKLNKPYPENDGGSAFVDCKKHNAYLKLLQACRDESTHSTENENTHKECLEKEVDNAIKEYLPNYAICLVFVENIGNAPQKDYGELLGDSDREEYPYKGYAHCLLQMMELFNKEEGLKDLKSKWENPKPLSEIMLEHQNEHRAWHSSPPLELDEELATQAQKWADHLAEDPSEECQPISSPFNSDRKYNGIKSGENVQDHSDVTLSDDEMAVITALTWYKESEFFPWPFDGTMKMWSTHLVGHFSQTVWKSSTKVGYAISRGTGDCQKLFVVARYWPFGNKFGSHKSPTMDEDTRKAFEENVFPSIRES